MLKTQYYKHVYRWALMPFIAGMWFSAAAQDVLTFHNDAARSGIQPNEANLAPSRINYPSFGKLLTFNVDGDVYAQPLYVSGYTMSDGRQHNVLLVATERDWVYAFDADGNNPSQGYLWRTSLLGSGETWVSSNDVGSGDITPDIGITGTPVVDRSGGTLYAVAKSKTPDNSSFFQRLHALDIANGGEKLNGPATIQATLPGTGEGGSTVSFSAFRNNQRPALLLAATPGGQSGSSIFISWSSHGDLGTYHGWVISYNASNISQQTGAFVDTPDGGQGGIWMSASGLASDGAGNIFAASGNGTFDANAGGSDYGDSLFRLNATSLSLADWFTPADQGSLNGADQDFGVSGPVLLPNQSGSVPHLVVTSDKSGAIYLANRDNLGHYNASNNPNLQTFGDGGYSIHSNVVFFDNKLYLAPDGGPVESWAFDTASERFNTAVQSRSTHNFGCNGCDGGGSNFSISANGTQNAILWAIDYGSFGNGPAVLYAYDPNNLNNELYASSQAANNRDQAPVAVKFASPTIANGKVFFGGRNAVAAYGLFNTGTPAAAAPSFSPAGGTYSSAQTVTLSDATSGATIYYTTDGSTPSSSSSVYSSPLSITATTTLSAIATAPGYTTSAVSSATYTISIGGGGGGGSVSYGSGFTGSNLSLNGSATLNGSRLRLTDGGVAESASAFFPTTLNIQSFTSDFSFQITNPNADGLAFVIQHAGKTALGLPGGELGYGSGASGIGQSIAIKFDLYNNSGEGIDSTGLYTNGASPTTPATDLTASGIDLHSGDIFSVHLAYDGANLKVTIRDTVTGKSAAQSYSVDIPSVVGGDSAYAGFTAGTGGLTAIQEILTWTFSSQSSTPPPPATPNYPQGFSANGLTLNAGAVISGKNLQLTDGVANERRSAFFSTPVGVRTFTSAFTFQITNPNADGLTFTIQGVGPTAIGPSDGGGGLGYGSDHPGGAAGIGKSVAIKFDVFNNVGEGNSSTGLYTNGASPTTPATNLLASGVDLHSGNVFSAKLVYNGATLSVTITDTVTKATATQTYTIDIPGTVGGNTAYAGFTAATGGLTATQDIQTWTYSN